MQVSLSCASSCLRRVDGNTILDCHSSSTFGSATKFSPWIDRANRDVHGVPRPFNRTRLISPATRTQIHTPLQRIGEESSEFSSPANLSWSVPDSGIFISRCSKTRTNVVKVLLHYAVINSESRHLLRLRGDRKAKKLRARKLSIFASNFWPQISPMSDFTLSHRVIGPSYALLR